MSLLHTLMKENAAAGATAAHAVASHAGSLFRGGMIERNKKRRMTKASRIPIQNAKQTVKNQNSWKWRVIGEMVEDDSTFDAADVVSKLDQAEKQSRVDQDTIAFGMEDEEGNIVKVYVRAEQADEFETALGSMLAGENEDDDEEEEVNDAVEIAEVLFQLKDKFDIVDVEWPEIEGDEEEEQEIAAGEEGMDFEGEGGGEMGDEEGMEGGDLEGMEGAEGEGDLEGMEGEDDLEMEPEGGAESALNQVIDMMKADAEARKAESEARAKEAEARAAEANASAAASKVKQEEEVLDMEDYNSRKKEEGEESKRLAQLAKWKHDQAAGAEAKMAEEEEERVANQGADTLISKNELMQKILHYLRAN